MSIGKQLPIVRRIVVPLKRLQLFTGRQSRVTLITSSLFYQNVMLFTKYKVTLHVDATCALSVCLSVCDLVSAPKFGEIFFNYVYYAVIKCCLAVPVFSHFDPQKISCGLRPRTCKNSSSESR
jgi:hypothetical protein